MQKTPLKCLFNPRIFNQDAFACACVISHSLADVHRGVPGVIPLLVRHSYYQVSLLYLPVRKTYQYHQSGVYATRELFVVSFVWYRDDAELDVAGSDLELLENGSLRSSRQSAFPAGRYHCAARNEHGVALSNYAVLTHASIWGVSPEGGTLKVSLAEGDSLTMRNRGPFSKPPADFEWALYGRETATGERSLVRRVVYDRRVNIDLEGQWVFVAWIEEFYNLFNGHLYVNCLKMYRYLRHPLNYPTPDVCLLLTSAPSSLFVCFPLYHPPLFLTPFTSFPFPSSSISPFLPLLLIFRL